MAPFFSAARYMIAPHLPFFQKKVYDWHGPEAIKLFSCSTQLSMKFVLLIKLRIMTKFWNFFHDQLSWARSAELSIKKFQLLVFLFLWPSEMSCSVELSMKKVYNLGARFFWIPMWKAPLFWHPGICTYFLLGDYSRLLVLLVFTESTAIFV